MASNRKRKSQRQRGPSDEVLLAAYQLKHRVVSLLQVLAWFVGLGLLMLCATPLAGKLAGRDTHVDLKISMIVGVSFAGVAATLGAYSSIKHRQVKQLRTRNKALVTRLKDAGVSVPASEIL